MWGFLKDNIYQDNPLTIAALKAAIAEKIQAINRRIVGELSTTLHAAFKNTFDRMVDIWSMYSRTLLSILFLI